MKIVLVSKDNKRSQQIYDSLSKHDIEWVKHPGTIESTLNRVNPDWVFVYHWSHIITEDLYSKFRMISFHTGNLPEDRGGSPLQNQILSGTKFTKVNAIVVQDPVDSGAVYASRSISLQGTLSEIWDVITDASIGLIKDILKESPTPVEQTGESKTFKRKKDNILKFDSIHSVYDQIRMLDSDEYPSTHLIIDGYKIDFSRAKIDNDQVIADVKIYKI